MADAFGDDLFNVFDEDAASNRPVPSIDDEVGEGTSKNVADNDDDRRRYV